MHNSTTIFKQLILNIILPVVIAIALLGALNYYHTQSILVEGNETKNELISHEIKNILKFQDYSFDIIENDLNVEIEAYSKILVEYVFKNTKEIENADLLSIREEIGMDASLQDIYIIDTKGIVVNTTYKRDLGLNFFSFGEEHKKHLLDILKKGKFVSERFTLETSTKKLKKYTYHPTIDSQYIVEIGVYSGKATRIIESFKEHLNKISEVQKDIISVEMFIGADNPISFNKDAKTSDKDREYLLKTFKEKTKQSYESEDSNGTPFSHQFIYMERKSTSLYKGAVIRIITDLTHERAVLRNDLIQLLVIFFFTILVVIFLIYNKTKIITKPLKKLVDNVNRITDGNLNERADVEGNNEIAKLSKQFNVMVENLEDSYNNLEQKVIQRTSEIQRQKDEIEEQKKHITDSINYAERIQYSFLATKKMLNANLGEYFVFFRPKDVVSGDFYWADNLANGTFAIVNADSTGHGVPGAIMSILNISSIEEAIKEGATSPKDIFNKARKFIIERLKKDGSENGGKDGMDASILCFNADKSKMTYTAAQNPIWIIRGGEIIQIKGEKMPVGKHANDHMPFIGGEFDLKKGDQIYTLTDGYQDQFGGPKGKKFMIKRMREYVLSISHLTMQEQYKKIDEVFMDWKGEMEQVDDVCVIGIKI